MPQCIWPKTAERTATALLEIDRLLSDSLRGRATRPVREYLAALETADTPDNPPKAISLTDPSSSWTAAHSSGVFA